MDYAALLRAVQNNEAVASEHGHSGPTDGLLYLLERDGIRFEDAFRVAVGRAIRTLACKHGVSELEVWLENERRNDVSSLVILFLEGLTAGLALK